MLRKYYSANLNNCGGGKLFFSCSLRSYSVIVCFGFIFFCLFLSVGEVSCEKNHSSIDRIFSAAVNESSKLTMTKSLTEASITAEKKSGMKRPRTDIWHYGFFKKIRRCDEYGLSKANMPEQTLLYLNQGYLRHKNNDNFFFADYFILAQVLHLADLPYDLSTYDLKPDEVKMFVTRYSKSTGQFLAIIETVGQIIVRGDKVEIFFDYVYCQKNSKLLYSTRKQKIPNSFSASMFPRHKTMHETGKLSPDFSKKNYYLPLTTDCSKTINKYMGQVYLKPMDVELGEFGPGFDPSALDN